MVDVNYNLDNKEGIFMCQLLNIVHQDGIKGKKKNFCGKQSITVNCPTRPSATDVFSSFYKFDWQFDWLLNKIVVSRNTHARIIEQNTVFMRFLKTQIKTPLTFNIENQ